MTEHVHVWMLATRDGIFHAVCLVDPCDEVMQYSEIETRINATERLSAEYAMNIWRVTHPSIGDSLKAYADILEGK